MMNWIVHSECGSPSVSPWVPTKAKWGVQKYGAKAIFALCSCIPLLGCWNYESQSFLSLRNYSDRDVYINDASIDQNKVVSNILLGPNKEKLYNPRYRNIRVEISENSELRINFKSGEEALTSSCRVKRPEYPQSCLLITSIDKNMRLKCYCDTYRF